MISVLLMAGAVQATAQTKPTQSPGTIAFNAPNAIHSMDAANTVYSSIQITGGTIKALSSQPIQGATNLPAGAAIYPGFIDSHSHAISLLLAQSTDPSGNPYWISLANVNVMLLPNCAKATPGSTTCFSAVKTQGTVNALLKAAKPNSAGWILGWNYEPARLACKVGGADTYGFQCPNFENQSKKPVLRQLDNLRSDVPVLITSESGHIVYVNTRALNALNICNVSAGATASCYNPIANVATERKLARTGQLDEDMALNAISTVEGLLASNYAGGSDQVLQFYENEIRSSLNLYSQLGYTTVQEGAASAILIKIYMAIAAGMAKTGKYLPVTMAFLEHDGTKPSGFSGSVTTAQSIQKDLAEGGFDMFVAGMKVFSDGSNQGFTGDMTSPVTYSNLNKPFLDSKIFAQPYDGLPDYGPNALTAAAKAAHAGGFPLWVHTNGNKAQTNVLGALTSRQSNTLRDVVVHFTMPTQAQVQSVPVNNVGVTFLANDYYYYYQPLCEQVLGTAATQNLYPAQWAQQSNLHYSLHSDAGVTPPAPLFGVWVASTRNYQRDNWLPKLSGACQAAVKASQRISRLQAMRAYTNEAAWLYHRETSGAAAPGIGSLQTNFAGDLVVLSADPLAPKTDLSTIYVLYTIHNGNIVYPASGSGPATSGPVWPK
jgi:predicted amidohydrolase YtcJ